MAEKLKLAFVDNSQAIQDQAVDAGEAKMTADSKELKGIGGFFKKIWRYNLARGYYRQVEINKAKQQILQSGNIYVAAGGSSEAFASSQEAITERFLSDYEEVIHQEAGETRQILDESPENTQFKQDMRRLIDDYAAGTIDDAAMEEEKIRLLNSLPGFSLKSEQAKIGYADNLMSVARQVKTMLGHQTGVARLDYDLEIVLGRAASGVRTEAKYNGVDKIIDKLGKTAIGSLVNESTLGLAVAAVTTAAVSASKSGASFGAKLLGGLGLGALLTGGLAALREGQELTRERKQHSREMAQGKTFQETDQRRAEMESFNYKTVKAGDLLNNLEIKTVDDDAIDSEAIKETVNKLADLEARIRLSDSQKIDLIAYSHITRIEQERFELDLARAQLKSHLQQLANENKLDLVGQDFNGYLANLVEAKTQELIGNEGGVREKDRLFQKMRQRRMVKTGTKAAMYGLGLGLVFQEVVSFFQDAKQGLLEGIFGHKQAAVGEQTATALEKARQMIFGSPHLSQSSEIIQLGDQQFRVPDGAELRLNNDGSYSLLTNNKELVGDIHLSADGHLMPESQAALAHKGVNWLTETNQVAGASGAKEIIGQNSQEFSNIHRQMWYDNDTKIFDKNELKIYWGGQYGSGLDKDGNILLDLRKMAADGSYHTLGGDKLSADAQDLIHNNGLKVVLSLSKGTQGQVIELPINTDGTVVIPKGSLAETLFSHSGGATKFNGAFMEIAQTMGNNEDGSEMMRILATQVGEGLPDGSTAITEVVHNLDITTPMNWEIPPILSFIGHQPLEPAEMKKISERLGYYGYGGESYGLLDRNKYHDRMSQKILENPELDLSKDDSEIVNEYLTKQNKQYMVGLSEMVKDVPLMDKNIEAVITVPAYLEGDILEKTLRNYAKLDNREKFEICILENHPKNKKRDNTESIIKRIQAEIPDLKIVHLYKVFDEKPAIGMVRKCLVDSVLLRKQQAGITRPIAIISNDADLEDINSNYVNSITDSFEQNPKLDALAAKWDFPRDTFKQMPLLHASQRLWQYLDIAMRNYYLKSPDLVGRNSIFNSGIYAAVGGYNETSQLAEDLEIGWLIKEARHYNSERISYNNKAWLISNPRRAVVKMLSDSRLVQQYGDFHVNEEVRNAPLEKLLENKIDFDKQAFVKEVQAIYNHYSKMTISKGGFMEDQYLEKSFTRAMRFMGIKFHFENDLVSIQDMSALEKSLEDYSN
jgi:hypothetical protein